jgi:hypothetical protein
MTQAYRTLRVAPSDEGVLGVVIDAPTSANSLAIRTPDRLRGIGHDPPPEATQAFARRSPTSVVSER